MVYKKCSRKGWCSTLDLALGAGKGLAHQTITNLMSLETRVAGVVYRKAARDRGIFLNFCPWCGEKINFVVGEKK